MINRGQMGKLSTLVNKIKDSPQLQFNITGVPGYFDGKYLDLHLKKLDNSTDNFTLNVVLSGMKNVVISEIDFLREREIHWGLFIKDMNFSFITIS